MKRRPKKPRALAGHFKDQFGQNIPIILAEVHERIYKVPGIPGDDLRANRHPVLQGGGFICGLTNKSQAEAAMKLSKWFFQYARWIASRPQGKV